jgi:hypothetical protein
MTAPVRWDEQRDPGLYLTFPGRLVGELNAMAWTETFHCDVCNKEQTTRTEDWWLSWTETFSAAEGEPEQRVVKVTPWNAFLAHSAGIQHLCGARCVHTIMDRWMMERD